jgi:CheY-like chemotaxis protein
MGALKADAVNGGRRVLVVDDNVELAENIAELLEIAGYATEIALSAEEALPKAMAKEVGFIVTDYRLPGQSGAELIRNIRQQGREIRAVVISAYTDEGTINAARAAGVTEFIAKPIDFGRLTQVIGGPPA